MYLTAIVSIALLWYPMIRRYGALKIWRVSLLVLMLSLIPMFFMTTLLFACIVGAVIGVGLGGVIANLDMINSDLIEEDAKKHGFRREATYFSGISFVTRISNVLRSGVFFLLVPLFGFVDKNNPGPNPGQAARFMMIVFPVILMALSFAVSLLVKFQNKNAGESDGVANADVSAQP